MNVYPKSKFSSKSNLKFGASKRCINVVSKIFQWYLVIEDGLKKHTESFVKIEFPIDSLLTVLIIVMKKKSS